MMVPLDDYRSLALFARVVFHRSFSAAAREAGIAKSAVSRRISLLEHRLGVRLLQRSTRALAVTDEGARLYQHCAALVAAASAAQDAVGASTGAVRGVLRVNAPVTFAQQYLAPALAGFLADHRELEIELTTDDRLIDVVAGGLDVVIRIGQLAPSSLVARRFAADRLVVCAAPAYLDRRGTPRSVAALVDHDCLHYALVDRVAEWRFRSAGPVTTRGSLSASDGTVLREAAVAGLGLAVLPTFMVTRELAAGTLRLVLDGARRAEIGLYAVTAHRTHAPPRTRAFVDFLVARFRRPAWARWARDKP
jgi:DNA-binding transcriptional LysR family regulator